MNALKRLTAALIISGGAVTAVTAADATKTPKVRSPASIECSKQADAKGLHGKERKKFRAECKKEFDAKAPTAPKTQKPLAAPAPKS